MIRLFGCMVADHNYLNIIYTYGVTGPYFTLFTFLFYLFLGGGDVQEAGPPKKYL